MNSFKEKVVKRVSNFQVVLAEKSKDLRCNRDIGVVEEILELLYVERFKLLELL